jgi:hypothetical protein
MTKPIEALKPRHGEKRIARARCGHTDAEPMTPLASLYCPACGSVIGETAEPRKHTITLITTIEGVTLDDFGGVDEHDEKFLSLWIQHGGFYSQLDAQQLLVNGLEANPEKWFPQRGYTLTESVALDGVPLPEDMEATWGGGLRDDDPSTELMLWGERFADPDMDEGELAHQLRKLPKAKRAGVRKAMKLLERRELGRYLDERHKRWVAANGPGDDCDCSLCERARSGGMTDDPSKVAGLLGVGDDLSDVLDDEPLDAQPTKEQQAAIDKASNK